MARVTVDTNTTLWMLTTVEETYRMMGLLEGCKELDHELHVKVTPINGIAPSVSILITVYHPISTLTGQETNEIAGSIGEVLGMEFPVTTYNHEEMTARWSAVNEKGTEVILLIVACKNPTGDV